VLSLPYSQTLIERIRNLLSAFPSKNKLDELLNNKQFSSASVYYLGSAFSLRQTPAMTLHDLALSPLHLLRCLPLDKHFSTIYLQQRITSRTLYQNTTQFRDHHFIVTTPNAHPSNA